MRNKRKSERLAVSHHTICPTIKPEIELNNSQSFVLLSNALIIVSNDLLNGAGWSRGLPRTLSVLIRMNNTIIKVLIRNVPKSNLIFTLTTISKNLQIFFQFLETFTVYGFDLDISIDFTSRVIYLCKLT